MCLNVCEVNLIIFQFYFYCYVCVGVGMYTGVQVCVQIGGVPSTGAGVTGDHEPLMSGTKSGPLEKEQVLLTSESPSQPLSHCF